MRDRARDRPQYTILLPTYNERDNIGLIVWLIYKHLRQR